MKSTARNELNNVLVFASIRPFTAPKHPENKKRKANCLETNSLLEWCNLFVFLSCCFFFFFSGFVVLKPPFTLGKRKFSLFKNNHQKLSRKWNKLCVRRIWNSPKIQLNANDYLQTGGGKCRLRTLSNNFEILFEWRIVALEFNGYFVHNYK